ncbi:MAG: RNA pseudouridine synthase, partial [Chitinophagales bacterium]|nr:RNA pseudouridine synthase [Chitinophagales bacterium]
VVHRLDRPVSGVMLFARTSKAAMRLSEQLRNREIQKTYWAVVKNKPLLEETLLQHYLIKNETLNKSFAYDTEKRNTKPALLQYKLIAALDHYFLLEVNPSTGRHHQIRVQLAKIGCPIKGDLKYGFERSNPDNSIHLHARKITFMHPVQKETVSIVADPPVGDMIWRACLSATEIKKA